MKENKKIGKLLVMIIIPVALLLFLLRFGMFYLKSDGLSGISFTYPLLVMGILLSALLMSGSFAAWVYKDCCRRGEDGILWAILVVVATPFIGLLVYFLRRPEMKRTCASCGHLVSLRANYCEECGAKIENKEEFTMMEMRRTHHMGFIVAGVIGMVLMITCLTGFIVNAAAGKGYNSNVASSEKIWNLGSIRMNYNTYFNGVWKLDFKSATDGYIAEEIMTIHQAESDILYADIACGTVPEGAGLTLYLVQNDIVKTFDVTDLSEPIQYSLEEFKEGEIYVRLLIEGVGDTVSEIYIE